MSRTVSRTTFWNSTYTSVVISPNTSTRPVVVAVSQATRAPESLARMVSRMASEIWSHILSGWPSVTDSEVNRYRGASRILIGLRVAGGTVRREGTTAPGSRFEPELLQVQVPLQAAHRLVAHPT